MATQVFRALTTSFEFAVVSFGSQKHWPSKSRPTALFAPTGPRRSAPAICGASARAARGKPKRQAECLDGIVRQIGWFISENTGAKSIAKATDEKNAGIRSLRGCGHIAPSLNRALRVTLGVPISRVVVKARPPKILSAQSNFSVCSNRGSSRYCLLPGKHHVSSPICSPLRPYKRS